MTRPNPGCAPTRSAASSCWTTRPASPGCRPTLGATASEARSALEWVLDQYKEKKPRDLTIRERFNTYRFADHKERVIDLLQRVCAVSVKTMEIVDGMAYWEDGYLIVFGDRDKHEWSMMGVEAMFSEPEDEEWLKQWLEM